MWIRSAAGDYPAAERIHKRYAALATGLPAAEAMVDAMLGVLQLTAGELQEACATLDRSISQLSQGFPLPWQLVVGPFGLCLQGAHDELPR
ncbi:hypothetical protein MAHJHV54_49150 [Mycobacterium avium subsp. hominissuis]